MQYIIFYIEFYFGKPERLEGTLVMESDGKLQSDHVGKPERLREHWGPATYICRNASVKQREI